MREHICYWLLAVVLLTPAVVLAIRGKLRLIDLVSMLGLWGGSALLDSVMSDYFLLYLYVEEQANQIYSAVYDATVYPAIALLFSRFFPVRRTVPRLLGYCLLWVVLLTLLELLYTQPTGVVEYYGWRIIPYSLYFYGVGFPLYTGCYLLMERWLNAKVKNTQK